MIFNGVSRISNNMDFIKTRKIFYFFSGIAVLISVLMIFVFNFNFGIDFTGGTIWELSISEINEEKLAKISDYLKNEKIDVVHLQTTAKDGVILRMKEISEEKHQELLKGMSKIISGLTEKRFESIGPSLGRELFDKSLWAVILVFFAILIYLSYAFYISYSRFPSYKYGLLAIATLLHDVLIICGFIILMGKLKGWEANSDFLVALLVVAGYSVHDTIVVYDRIRENLQFKKSEKEPLITIMNHSINQVILRSLYTSLTTLFPLIALYFFGPASIRILIASISAGIVVGTYSSLFIAPALLYDWSSS